MKNLETKIRLNEDSKEGLKYSELISICISQMDSKEGRDINEMRKIISISDSVEKVEKGKEIKLKAEDAVFVKEKVKTMKWLFDHRDIVAFSDEVEKL